MVSTCGIPLTIFINPIPMNRTQFMQKSLLTGSALFLPSLLTRGQQTQQVQERPAPLKLEIVKEFVTVAHGNFQRTQEMLENDNLLLHVSNDWGGGDYESAIEACGHTGNKEIANYLLGKGARYNTYLACMLGHIDTVKNVLSFSPGLLNSKGPHGFTMLHHAKKGGESSKAVEEYLLSLGAKETKLDFWAKA
jgi:hypothetical protein